MSNTIVVVGGSGVFGARLCERLAQSLQCTLIIAGRSLPRSEAVIATLRTRPLQATLRALVLDREHADATQLRAVSANIVVDAAGPFQGHEPNLARAAIAAGCHFIDLADARDYVAKFTTLDEQARAADVLAVCGASSTPSLSHAVLDALCAGITVEQIDVCITPGNRAPRGLAVVQAILSYVGHPVRVWEQGHWRMRPGWSQLHRRHLHGLAGRWFSLCETPDLDLIPARFPAVRTARFYAGLELSVLHCGLWSLAWLVRAGLLRSLLPYARHLQRMAQWFERCGTDRGGMLVAVRGWSDAGRTSARWELLAEAGDGPYIPVLPAVALLRRLIAGEEARRGAMACAGLLTREQILDEGRGLRLATQQHVSVEPMLFRHALGSDFERLPAPIRALHSVRGPTVFTGRADIDAGSNVLARLLARVFRFPAAARQTTVEVHIDPHGDSETWRRHFGKHSFASVLGRGVAAGRLSESFGPVCCQLRVVANAQGLELSIEGARFGVLPLPRWLAPWTRAAERVDEHGRFNFDVEIGLHGVGRLVRYRGWLKAG